MTGSEIVWWLEDIWYDLLHLGTADIPLLLIRLFVLAAAVFFGWQLGKMVFRAVWAAVAPVLEFAWRVATAPVRLPVRAVKRVLRLLRMRRYERERRREELAEVERLRAREQEEARQRAEALAEVRKILDVD